MSDYGEVHIAYEKVTDDQVNAVLAGTPKTHAINLVQGETKTYIVLRENINDKQPIACIHLNAAAVVLQELIKMHDQGVIR